MKPNINLKNKSGIYKITNLVNNKVYIGKTKCFHKRIYQYLYDIKHERTNHINAYLLNSIKKYGINNFDFSVIEFNDNLDNLSNRELYWIKQYNSINSLYGYNLRMDSSTQMYVHEETSKKISARLKEEWKSGVRKDHSKKLKKSWENNFERKQNQSKLLSQIKTKYTYILSQDNKKIEECNFKRLKELKLQNCLATFKVKNENKISFKGYIIERILI